MIKRVKLYIVFSPRVRFPATSRTGPFVQVTTIHLLLSLMSLIDSLPDGSRVMLSTIDERLTTAFVVGWKKANGHGSLRSKLTLTPVQPGEGSLRCKVKSPGEVDYKGGGGVWAQWEVLAPPPEYAGADFIVPELPDGAIATLALRNVGMSATQAAAALEAGVPDVPIGIPVDAGQAMDGQAAGSSVPMFLTARSVGGSGRGQLSWAVGRAPAALIVRRVAVHHPRSAPTPTHGGAAAPIAKACPSGCGFAVTWHVSHCCALCSVRPGQHGGRCARKPLSAGTCAPAAPVFDPNFTLSAADLKTFERDGMVVIPGAVGKELIDQARRAVNMRLSSVVDGSATERGGEGGAAFSHDEATRLAFEGVITSPRLFSSLHSLIGPHSSRGGGQIALNFPAKGQSKEAA